MKKIDFTKLPTPHIGVDEVGRGCLAGPVTAAAVIFNCKTDIRKYKDSKQLEPEERTKLSASIHKHHMAAIGWASVEEIDELNILQASLLAMRRAIHLLEIKSGTILVDGLQFVPDMGSFEQRAIVRGDEKLRLISAASIVAKVARDQFMTELAGELGEYGFDRHKGYGTLFHRKQLQLLGPSKWHRRSFCGVKEFLE